jgi:hypothetical protein
MKREKKIGDCPYLNRQTKEGVKGILWVFWIK